MGTRDETLETSGSLLSIKNTYYKTVLNTNETVYIILNFRSIIAWSKWQEENSQWTMIKKEAIIKLTV